MLAYDEASISSSLQLIQMQIENTHDLNTRAAK